jgi:hypothetical protein
MSDATPSFAFSQFVPGFDFLKSLTGAAAGSAGAVPGMPSLSSWVAPTLSIEEVDKRIQELKTVQYWLEQNGHALKATIQALEVQKMTLSTLRGMNVQMEDLAKAFTRSATVPAKAPAEAAREPEPAAATPADKAPPTDKAGSRADAEASGVVDPLQWWSALTQQFQQIASSALQDAAHLKRPATTAPHAQAADKAGAETAARTAGKPAAAPKKKTAVRKAPRKAAAATAARQRPRGG